jgi:hypothetical protein
MSATDFLNLYLQQTNQLLVVQRIEVHFIFFAFDVEIELYICVSIYFSMLLNVSISFEEIRIHTYVCACTYLFTIYENRRLIKNVSN